MCWNLIRFIFCFFCNEVVSIWFDVFVGRLSDVDAAGGEWVHSDAVYQALRRGRDATPDGVETQSFHANVSLCLFSHRGWPAPVVDWPHTPTPQTDRSSLTVTSTFDTVATFQEILGIRKSQGICVVLENCQNVNSNHLVATLLILLFWPTCA